MFVLKHLDIITNRVDRAINTKVTYWQDTCFSHYFIIFLTFYDTNRHDNKNCNEDLETHKTKKKIDKIHFQTPNPLILVSTRISINKISSACFFNQLLTISRAGFATLMYLESWMKLSFLCHNFRELSFMEWFFLARYLKCAKYYKK